MGTEMPPPKKAAPKKVPSGGLAPVGILRPSSIKVIATDEHVHEDHSPPAGGRTTSWVPEGPTAPLFSLADLDASPSRQLTHTLCLIFILFFVLGTFF